MFDMNFTPDHPIALTIAADARLTQTDYVNDHIWEVNFGYSEPPALSIQTTFGLRARVCRIFPRFILNGQVINNPSEFYRPITIHRYCPNYISLSFKPFSSINVNIEYWVPGSQLIAARSKITNTHHEICQFHLEWAELLIPGPDGNRMSINEIGTTTILAGSTADLIPILFLTGGVQAGKSPYPSLNLSYKIAPHKTQSSRWAHATLSDIKTSFDLAKELFNQNWDAEFARIFRLNSQDLEIITGNQDWDNAFYLSQVLANQLFLSPTKYFPSPSFILSRKPDQGFSLLKDGSDYDHLWNGQTALDTYYLTNFLLPASTDLLKGLLENFLNTQSLEGEIDWKPGLGGQRSALLCTPLLARMSMLLFEYTQDIETLKAVYPKLLNYFFSWISSAHDRDEDGIPEWDKTIQTGYEENPHFSYIFPWSMGIDISTVESPDLISYLYSECQALHSISDLLADTTAIPQLDTIANKLKTTVIQSWSDQFACYRYQDRDTHFSTPIELLGKLSGAGIIEIHREFPQAVRPFIHIKLKKESTLPIQIYIHGLTPKGAHRVDHISAQRIHWHHDSGFVTSEAIYQSLEQIQVSGISNDIEVIAQAGCQKFLDHTLLLPLWAGIASDEQAKIMINLTIMNKKRFLSPYGIRSCTDSMENSDLPDELLSVHPLFMSFIMDGLIQYGEQKKAAEVFTRLMKATVNSLKLDMKFHQSYHSETGKPFGASNSLTSLIPIGSFLKILGVKIINSTKVEINGNNPFPWPVTIKYRGLTVVQQERKALVIFPDGQNITVENNKSQMISIK